MPRFPLTDKDALYLFLFACKIKKSRGNALTLCVQSLCILTNLIL